MTTTTELKSIALSALIESPANPRRHHDAKAHAELVESVKAKGIITPLLVRPNGGAGKFEIVAGHRRARAAKAAGLDAVPGIVRDLSDQDALEIMTIENLQREDVHPLDEAEGYTALMKARGYGVEDLAAKVGKSKSYVYQRLKLSDLIPAAKTAFWDDKITAGHAILIARLQPADQAEALQECADRGGETISVRALAHRIAWQTHRTLSAAPWRKDDATLLPEAGSCQDCHKRTGNAPELFADIERKDTCTDPGCYRAKLGAHVARTKERLEREGDVIEITTVWSHAKPKKGAPIPAGQWREVEKKNPCEHAVKAVVVPLPQPGRGANDDDKSVGQTKLVCVDPVCKKHFDQAANAKSPEERAKDRQRTDRRALVIAVRERVVDAICGQGSKIPTAPSSSAAAARKGVPGDLEMARFVGEQFFHDIWHDARVRLSARLGWGEAKKSRTSTPGTDLRKLGSQKIAAMEWPEITRLFIECALARELVVSAWSTEPLLSEPIKRAAKIAGVDAEKIAREVKAEASAKAKSAKKPGKAKAEKAVQSSAKKRKGRAT